MKQHFKLILASSSPRRKQLLAQLGYTFEIATPDIDETPDPAWALSDIAEQLAIKKCRVIADQQLDTVAVLAADCTVVYNNGLLEKPADKAEAMHFLGQLSGNTHKVISGYALAYQGKIHSGSSTTKVYFNELSQTEIEYYVENYKTLDKAGGYGIQDWIGLTAVQKIEGSYTNIVGLPTAEVYQLLKMIKLES